jgi:hypothetical protein
VRRIQNTCYKVFETESTEFLVVRHVFAKDALTHADTQILGKKLA